MRRFAFGVLLVLALAVGLAALFRKPLALAVMERVLTRNLSRDFIGELPDGLHVGLCGAGGPLPDPVRSGPCVAVVAGTSLFIVDAGAASSRNLPGIGLPPGRVEAVFLTHVHSDHIDGLGELAMQRWVGAAHDTPLPVIGSNGVEQVVGGFDQAYRLDAHFRTTHHGPKVAPPTGAGMSARSFPPPAPKQATLVWDRDGIQIRMFSVDHRPVEPAVGYRFDYGGRSVVVSGDTKRSANLLHFARGVDLLVHEALSPRLAEVIRRSAEAAGRPNVAKIAVDILDYHTTPVEAAEIAQEAGAGHLLFYHVVPPQPLPGLASVFLEGVGDAYDGGVTLGRDGTMISLPVGSETITVH